MASWFVSVLCCAAVAGSQDCTLVHFTAGWCEPCRQIQPGLEKLRQEGWTVRSVDVDQDPQLVQRFRIENLPTVVIMCRDQEVDRLVGAAPYEQIKQRATRAAARNHSGGPASASQLATAQVPNYDGQSREHDLTSVSGQFDVGSTNVTSQQRQPIVRGQSPGLAAFPMLSTLAGGVSKSEFEEPSSAANLAIQPAKQLPSPSLSNPSQASPRSQVPELSVEQAIARAAAATVRIRVDEGNTTAYGTGTIVDVHGDEALILTCGHLFRDMQPASQLTIDLFPGTPREVNLPSQLIDFKAEDEDIGLISFRLPVAIEPVPLSPRGLAIEVGSPAFSFGCDHGNDPTRRDTRISRINRYIGADNIEIQGAPAVGRSGGGLFDMQGRLIGVCNAANAADDEGIYAAADVVYTQIERLGLSHLFESPASAVSSPVGQLAVNNNPQADWAASTWEAGGADERDPGLQAGPTPAHADSLGQQFAAQAQVPARADVAPAAGQLICIVRDVGGTDRVVTINAPPAQLLDMIHRSAAK